MLDHNKEWSAVTCLEDEGLYFLPQVPWNLLLPRLYGIVGYHGYLQPPIEQKLESILPA